MIYLPGLFYELAQVLQWGAKDAAQLEVKDLVHHKLLTRTDKGWRMIVGTKRFGDGARVLLLDSSTVATILAYLLALPASSSSSPSEPIPLLKPVSLFNYTNVNLVELKSRKKIEAKLWNLNGTNKRRARKMAERAELLEEARKVVEEEGTVVAISIVLHDVGKRRKKVMEIGVATWSSGALVEVTHIKISEYLHLKNGAKVPDRRDAFAHGVSQVLPFEDARKLLLEKTTSTATRSVNVLLHSAQQTSALLDLPARRPPPFDVEALFRAKRHDQEAVTGLVDMLKFYRIDFSEQLLFNAGNNAKYLLDVFLKLGGSK